MNAVDRRLTGCRHEDELPICLECPDCHGRGALAAPRRGVLATLHRWVLGRPWMEAHGLPCPTCRGDGCVEHALAS